jgi:hypothetical protein
MGTTKWAVVWKKTAQLLKASAFCSLLVLGGCRATTQTGVQESMVQPDHCDKDFCNVGKKPKT